MYLTQILIGQFVFQHYAVIPTYKEPLVGWVDNLYGPMSILYGVAHGVIRVLYIHLDTNANLAPVDMCANMMLVAAWNTAKHVNQM